MQPVTITAFFTDNGIPILTLTPTIKIRKVSDGSLIIDGENMSSVGEGQYSYNFILTEADELYTIVCDGGETLSNSERYSYASCETPPVTLIASFV